MAQSKRIAFTDGSTEIPSMSKFLSHLYHIGAQTSRWELEQKHIQKKEQGTITIEGKSYTFHTIYLGMKSNTQDKPQKSAFTSEGKLRDDTHKIIYELTPSHMLELTMSNNNTLLHTKSITL